MQITNLDILATVIGAVAIIFSGFVLAHSPWGGVALFGGGAVALSIPLFGDGHAGVVPIAWIVFLSLIAVGLAGFLVGFGVFDAPEVQADADATLHDANTDDATVLVTGSVRNVGDAPADAVTVTVRLYDADGDELDRNAVRLRHVAVGSEQQFYARFEDSSELSSFDTAEIETAIE